MFEISRETDHSAGKASTCIPCFFRLLISSSAFIVSIFMDYNWSPQNWALAVQSCHSVLKAGLRDASEVTKDVTKISNMPDGIVTPAVCFGMRVKMRSCSFATLSEVAKLVNMGSMITLFAQSDDQELKIKRMKGTLLMQCNDPLHSRVAIGQQNTDGWLINLLNDLLGMLVATPTRPKHKKCADNKKDIEFTVGRHWAWYNNIMLHSKRAEINHKSARIEWQGVGNNL